MASPEQVPENVGVEVRLLRACLEEVRQERDLYSQTLADANRLYDAKLRELAALHRVSTILRNVQSSRQVCTGIVDIMVEEVGAANCSLMCLDRAIGRLTIRAARGQSDHAARYFDAESAPVSFSVGEGVAGWVAQHAEPVLIPDVGRDPRFKPFEIPESSVRSLLCLPLVEGDQVWGVLNLSHPDLDAFTEDNERILSIVAGQAAIALANVQLFAQLQQMNEALEEMVTRRTSEVRQKAGQLAVINQIAKTVNAAMDPEEALPAIAGQIHRLVSFEIFCVVLFSEGAEGMRTIRLAHGGGEPVRDLVPAPPAGSMLARAFGPKPFIFSRADDTLRALVGDCSGGMMVPLIFKDQARGVIVLSHRGQEPYHSEQLRIMEDLADHIAVALEKSRLNKTLQRMNEELEDTVAARTRELADSEVHYRTLFEESTDGILLVDDAGRVSEANERWLELTGRRLQDAGETQLMLGPHEAPVTVVELARTAPQSGSTLGDVRVLRPDGGDRYVDLLMTPIVLLARRHVLAVAHDTTERRHLEEQLLRSEKMAAMGTLAASVAHEINNPLEGIKNCINILRNRLPDQGAERQILDQVSRGFVRIRDIVRQILDFHRPGTEAQMPVDVNTTVTEVVNLVRNDFRNRNIRLDLATDGNLPPVLGSVGRLQQVFTNILLNAAESIEGSGQVRVRTTQENGMVLVEFADTGCGIAPEDLETIFQPFFSRKRSGRGTGLGLWISHLVVCEHRGEIRVNSTVGKGTTISVLLPAHTDGEV